MKVKLHILEVNLTDYAKLASDWQKEMELMGSLGSRPATSGDVREGMTVPAGKVWLFPQGSNFAKVERLIKGERIVKTVEVK